VKPGTKISTEANIRLRGMPMPYVSRGGLKLVHALDTFQVDPSGLRCLDVGISTGGFTDCLLQRGAVQVVGVDVGRAQVDWKLRQDPRVILFEETNFRYIDPNKIGSPFDLCVIDVSFISLTLILPVVAACISPGGLVLPLVKPQFEVGRENLGNKGVVRDPEKRLGALQKISQFSTTCGFQVLGETESPVPGPEGNIEYLLKLERCGPSPSPLPGPRDPD
jgi:23S rRNA (cytidine1920-2'-O)/16S rRNA (cytidine1409-2'-O)-methyltransferase